MKFSKTVVRDALTTQDIYELLIEFGGDPEWTSFGIISYTICHNHPNEECSRKLYYYENTGLFNCYTGCGSFDIFELVQKIQKIQHNEDFDLNDAVRYIAYKFAIDGEEDDSDETLDNAEDWKILNNYLRIGDLEVQDLHANLKSYDSKILNALNYNLRLEPWLQEGISQESINHAHIGFYPGGSQITIPHYDINGNFIGLRGRTVIQEDAERFGKYRPIQINKVLYTHPLGMNLYNLNNSKDNIRKMGKAIIFESEKSTMLYQSYFGIDNDISVACCGSNISAYQIQLLLDCGAKEIVIAFDRQFQKLGDDEFQHLRNNLLKIRKRFKNSVLISFIFDKNMITGYKAAPIDEGKEKFLKLFKERIVL